MQKRNYQKVLDKLTADFSATSAVPKLLIHSCCAPCSSYVLEYLSNYFEITVLYYNPNIYPEDEYFKREAEQELFINRLPTKNEVTFMKAEFEPKQFYDAVKGLEFDAVIMDDSVLAHPQTLNLAERMERAVYLGLDEKNILAKYVKGRKIL